VTTATVRLWGTNIGYVSMEPGEAFARFEYDPDFVGMGIELAPLEMPLESRRVYQFPDLHPRAFHGLPGLLADSLPDKYGNRLIDVWLARTGRRPEDFNAVDRLCYVGARGMGALEFEPASAAGKNAGKPLQIKELVELASIAFASKQALDTRLAADDANQGLLDILSVGASAGGARAKAVIAYERATGTIRSGQMEQSAGFEHWLIKFDGVEFSGDWGVADPAGYGLLEFSYFEMAKRCSVDMMECRLLHENGRSHFMTRRFDRGPQGDKYFAQTLAAIKHFDYWETGAYSYEQVIMTMRELGMPLTMIEQQVRRIIFNLVACNQDDHVKNISFMMDRQGQWSLSPAYDMCHSQGSVFTRTHQLSLNGKTSNFVMADLKHLAQYAGLPRGREKQILATTLEAFSHWELLAAELVIPLPLQKHVLRTLRLSW
jgi:serine/threonine-protein kinase HipA